jgi:Organic solvent tolerance protein OstA
MKRILITAFLATMLLIIFPALASAGNDQAKVTADEVSYDYESKQVEAVGNVKIEYKDIKIEADYALIDQEQDILLATGKLEVTNKNSTYHGDRFLYFLKTDQGWISPLNAEITDLDIKGPAYMTAAEAFIKGEDIRSKHATFSTCNLEHPHYHLSASAMEYYPGDVLIMHNVLYWESFIPVFYLPLLYVSLKKDNFEVLYGESSTEGWYVDAKYYYYHFPGASGSGNLHIRLTEYGGNLYEVDQIFNTSKTGVFIPKVGILEKSNMTNPAVSYYTRDDGATYEPKYDDYMLGFSYKEYLNPKILTNQALESWYHYKADGDTYINTLYNLNISGQSPYPSLTLTFEDQGQPVDRTVNLSTNWNCNPDKTSSVNLNGQWYYQGYIDQANSNSNISKLYTLNAKKNWDWSNLALTVSENRVDSLYSSGTSIVPDIVYTIPKITLPVLKDIQIATQYTKMERFSGDITSEGERYALDLNKSSDAIWKQGPFTLRNQSALKYRDFIVSEVETDLSSLSTQLNFMDQFTKEFNTSLNIGYAVTNGTPNSYFNYNGDTDLTGFYAENIWNYSSQTMRASANTKYNFENQYAYPLYMTFGWNPATTAGITFNTVYNWGVGPGQTDFSARYNPNSDCNISIGLGYDFSNKVSPWTSQSFVANISQKINDTWSYSLAATYNYLARDFSVAECNLIYDWHCRQIVLHYDYVEAKYWLQFIIKAFPNSSVRLTGNDTLESILSGIETD